MDTPWKFDCRNFDGFRPCRFYNVDKSLCENCKGHYDKIKERIILIELGALGGVLRSTPITVALRKKYPNSHLTWLVEKDAYQIVKNNPYVDRFLIYEYDTISYLLIENFDILINLDKRQKFAALTSLIKAGKKFGFGLNEYGKIYPVNKGAEYRYDIALDDWGKNRENTKSHQQMIFDIAELEYNNEEYVFNLDKEDIEFADEFAKKNLDKNIPTIGLNTGCGKTYSHKKWSINGFVQLIDKLNKEMKVNIILFGGPDEIERNKEIKLKIKSKVIDSGNNNSLMQFAALLNLCDVVIAGDTLAMHLAIALKKHVLCFFGPTPYAQIDIYNRGKKFIGKVDCLCCYDEFPCIKEAKKEPNCMETITADEVFDEIKKFLKK